MPVLDFKGKSIIYSHHLEIPFRSLEVDKARSFPPCFLYRKNASTSFVKDQNSISSHLSLNDNLIIHGDNLHALKALLPRYAGKVKCVYIDPPYNTGNEGWKYNDKVNSPLIKEWFKQSNIGMDDLERHDKWLCMMWPRLQLLKELLSPEGIIFISIDDNEVCHLKQIMDEIFGEDNFIAQVTAQTNPRGRSLRKDIAITHEYILIFSKNRSEGYIQDIPKTVRAVKAYNKRDKKGKYRLLGLRNSGIQFFNKNTRPNLFFPIYVDPCNGRISLLRKGNYIIKVLPVNPSGREGCWTWSKKKIQNDTDLIVGVKKRGSNTIWRIYRKDYLPKEGGTTKQKSLWLEKDLNHGVGKQILRQLFKGDYIFEFPKSPELVKKCLRLISDKKAIILDSFAGSGTTAHAVYDLNKEDGGSRRFILVECEDYADEITAERVRRLMKKDISKKGKTAEGFNSAFRYCTLEEEFNKENLLKGKALPSYKALCRYIFYTATGKILDKIKTSNLQWFVGETESYRIYLVYQPNLDFLRSKESALHIGLAEEIKKASQLSKKINLVFASAKYVTQKELLKDYGIQFCQLPYAIYKMMKV